MLFGFGLLLSVTVLFAQAQLETGGLGIAIDDSSPLRGIRLPELGSHVAIEPGNYLNGTDVGTMDDMEFGPPSELQGEINLGHQLHKRNLFARATCITYVSVEALLKGPEQDKQAVLEKPFAAIQLLPAVYLLERVTASRAGRGHAASRTTSSVGVLMAEPLKLVAPAKLFVAIRQQLAVW
jgi:hypothetical protein